MWYNDGNAIIIVRITAIIAMFFRRRDNNCLTERLLN